MWIFEFDVFILQHYLRQLEPNNNPANQLKQILQIPWKTEQTYVSLCGNYVSIWKKEWWKTILFDCVPPKKDDFHLRWKESSKCNWVLFTRDMACKPCKEDFLSLKQSEQTEVHSFAMPPPFRRRRHYVFGLSVLPSVRPKPKIPSFDLYMGPLVHPTNRNRFTACPSIRLSVRPSVCPSVRRGFRAFAGECMEGLACNFTCWCIFTVFRTD